MKSYLGEHEIVYVAASITLGTFGGTVGWFFRRSKNPAARVELWALFGGLVGLSFAFWMILLAPVIG